MRETVDQKAERLLAEGCVEIHDTQPLYTFGHVQGDHDTYLVLVYTSDLWWCSCMWGQIHAMTGSPCAHARALRLAVERRQP